jgi:type II secretory pathway pseudopilin PulG
MICASGGSFFDSTGLVITIVLGLAAIAVPIWVYLKQRSRKDLAKDVQVTRLVSIHNEAKGRITIHFEGEQIEQVHLVEVRLTNSGNVPIRPEDFERPITIELGSGTPLSADIAETTPARLDPKAQITPRGVELQPLLLNTGDSLKLKILVRDFAGEIAFDYRIVGISQLMDARLQAERSWSHRLFGSSDLLSRFMATLVAGTVVFVGVGALTSGVGSLVDNSGTHSRPRPAYAPSHDYFVIFRNGGTICARVVFSDAPDRGRVTVIPKKGGYRYRRVFPRSAIKAIRPTYC